LLYPVSGWSRHLCLRLAVINHPALAAAVMGYINSGIALKTIFSVTVDRDGVEKAFMPHRFWQFRSIRVKITDYARPRSPATQITRDPDHPISHLRASVVISPPGPI